MAIRFLLVSLVAGLSLELPSNDEINGWAKAGRTWVAARLDDWSVTTAQRAREANDRAFRTIVDDMSRSFTESNARLARESNDRAFRTIVDDMSRSFSDDLARLDSANQPARALAAVDPTSVSINLETGLAAELARQTKAGVTESATAKVERQAATAFDPILVADQLEDPAAFVLGLDSPAQPKIEPTAVVASTSRAPAIVERTEQISSALQLTRQALTAWASVIQGSNTMVRR